MSVDPVASLWLETWRFINIRWSKCNDVTTSNGEVPYQLLSQSCFYYPNLITAAPLLLKVERYVRWLRANDITNAWGGVISGTFSDVYLVSKFYVSNISVTGDNRFSN